MLSRYEGLWIWIGLNSCTRAAFTAGRDLKSSYSIKIISLKSDLYFREVRDEISGLIPRAKKSDPGAQGDCYGDGKKA